MTTELEQIRALRPVVEPPSERARGDAWQRLMAAIEDEPAGLHTHRHVTSPSRRPPGGGLDRGRRLVHRLRPSLALAAAVAVVAVVVGAIVVLAGRHSDARLAPASPGTIGAGGHPLVPGVIRSGLAETYRSQLAAGESLHTFLDPALQRTGRRALTRSLELNSGAGGAFVAMDPTTGAVHAIGSVGRGHARSRLVDIATGVAAPVGMTFAPITVLAALRSGAWLPSRRFDDTGEFCTGAGSARQCLSNSGHAAYGLLDTAAALGVEDDAFLADLGVRTEAPPTTDPNGGAIQTTARELGIGAPTGIDLPGQAPGLVPSPATPGALQHRRWSVDDNESLALGQGGVAVSPVQLAVAYAALANGGTVVRPRVVSSLSHDGATLDRGARRRRSLVVAPAQLRAVRAGLRRAVSATGGAASDTLGTLPVAVSGQVGTTEDRVHGRENTSAWFAGYAPATDGHGPLVVVVYADRGGLGDVAAAPVARELFSQWFTGHAGPYVAGASTAG